MPIASPVITDADLKKCLKPISPKAPAGSDLRHSPDYDAIKEASRADPNLPQGVWTRDIKSSDWRKVEKLCLTILQKKSKDLLVTAWLIEAWMHLYALDGVFHGFDLLERLTKKFWVGGYPVLSTTDPEYRAGPYEWINEKLSERLSQIYITDPEGTPLPRFTYASSIDVQSDSKTYLDHTLKKVDLDDHKKKFNESLQKTPTPYFERQIKMGQATLHTLKILQGFLDSHLGTNAPSLNRVNLKIQKIIDTFNSIVMERKTVMNLEKESTSPDTPDTPTLPASPNVIDGVIHSRAEAYAIIEKAAIYLEQLDPHSPAPPLIKRAVSWGKLSFADLIQELAKEGSSLEELKRFLGLTIPPSPKPGEPPK